MTFYLVHPKGLVVRSDGDRVALPSRQDAMSLGITGGEDLGGGDMGAALVVAPGEPFAVAGLRELFPVLGEAGWHAAGRAVQIVEWAATHRFCGRCATPTGRVDGERCMRCPACGLTAYPRIAPAVIVLVRRGGEVLLARGARFPLPFYSTLAGFVEVGESLEQTVEREIREEVGVEVANVRYFGSQPWPFPHSLMVGYTADWAGGDIRIDENEIVDAQWFRADALPAIPPRLSIARSLIDAWLADLGVDMGDEGAGGSLR
jgi:NAD+ diphosphatase